MAVAATDVPANSLHALLPLWHPSAPAHVVDACGDMLPVADWAVWQKHLAQRKRPRQPSFLSGKEPPLLWGLPGSSEFGDRREDLNFDEVIAPRLPFGDGGRIDTALRLLGRAYALPTMAQRMPADDWWSIVTDLHDIAQRSEGLRRDLDSDPDVLVEQQLLAGELPLALGYQFPEVRALRELRGAGRSALSEALVEWTDGQGLPHGRLLPMLGPLWACWTRARWIGSRLKRGPWSREAEIQYQWLVRHAIRLTGPDGRFLLPDADDDFPDTRVGWSRGMYRSVLGMVGDPWDCAAAVKLLPKGTLAARAANKFADHESPEISLNSEWSGVGVLASGWSRSATRLALNWADLPVKIDFSIGNDRLLSGDWTFRTTCDGAPVSISGEWEQACWQSGKKCDYLELGIELSHGLRLERQVILSRQDQVVYLADAVVSIDGAPRRIVHTQELPLAADVIWQPEAETRDGVLVTENRSFAVLPLALAEWRSDPRGGRLEIANGRLLLTQEISGRALYSPLLFDLKRKRSRTQRTWRQLTVVEMLEITPPDTAVGFRAQSGKKQWLIYRSLGPTGNRTVLGQNISGEFYAGRVKHSGKMAEWIEIEPVERDESRTSSDK